ncbi:transposase family protein [Streptomyces puniciscabiei]|uniref:transposase family protein n=1 Tax=Streptomyces puniciscabiei TaxID=164348 RepID=UPI00332609D7
MLPAVASKTVKDVLFPGIDVRVERVNGSSRVLVVEAVSTARPGRCPDCPTQARRVHSAYQRTLDERPLGARRVVVRLRVRRYFCDRKRCSRKTFVEQVPGLSERHRRSSTGPTGWLRSIAIELGGRPAARLRRRLRMTAGRTRAMDCHALRGHLINVHTVISEISVSIRQVGADSPVSSRDILLAIAQRIIVRDLCGRAS